MCPEKIVPEQNIRLPDSAIAQLLGLSLNEYHKLSHMPLEDFRDIDARPKVALSRAGAAFVSMISG